MLIYAQGVIKIGNDPVDKLGLQPSAGPSKKGCRVDGLLATVLKNNRGPMMRNARDEKDEPIRI